MKPVKKFLSVLVAVAFLVNNFQFANASTIKSKEDNDTYNLSAPLSLDDLGGQETMDIMKLSAEIENYRQNVIKDHQLGSAVRTFEGDSIGGPDITIDEINEHTGHPRKGDRVYFGFADSVLSDDGKKLFIPCSIQGEVIIDDEGRYRPYRADKTISREYLCCAIKLDGEDTGYHYEFYTTKDLMEAGYRGVGDFIKSSKNADREKLAENRRDQEFQDALARFVKQQNETDRIIYDSIVNKKNNLVLDHRMTSESARNALFEKCYNSVTDFIRIGLSNQALADEIDALIDLGQVMLIPGLKKPHAGGVGIYFPWSDDAAEQTRIMNDVLTPKVFLHEILARCGLPDRECEIMELVLGAYINRGMYGFDTFKDDISLSAIGNAKTANFKNRFQDPLNVDYHKLAMNIDKDLKARMAQKSRKPTEGNWYLGIDSSSQSVTFIVIDTDTKEVIFKWREAFDDPYYKKFGTEQGLLPYDYTKGVRHTSPLMIATALDRGLSYLSKRFDTYGWDMRNIRSISGAGQQHGTVYLNKSASETLKNLWIVVPLWRQLMDERVFSSDTSPMWQDTSTEEEVEILERLAGGPDALRRLTGSNGALRFSLPQIMAMFRRYKHRALSTYRIMNIAAYNGALLSGRTDFPWDLGDGAGANAMNVETGEWAELVDKVGEEIGVKNLRNMLGKIEPSDKVIGKIADYWVRKYGFDKRTKVVNFTGDNPSAMAGQGIIDEGQVAISLGTSYTMYTFVPKDGLEAALEAPLGHVFGEPTGQYMKLVCFQNGDVTLQTLRNSTLLGNMNISEDEAVERIVNETGCAYPSADDIAKSDWQDKIKEMRIRIFTDELKAHPAGNDGAMMIPMHKTEAVVKIPMPEEPFTRNLDMSDRAKVFRAAVEGQAYFMKWIGEQIKLDIKSIKLTGGVANNEVVRQVIADVFGVPVYVSKETDAVALGGAIRAAKADLNQRQDEVAVERNGDLGGLERHYGATRVMAKRGETTWSDVIRGFEGFDEEKITEPIQANVDVYKKNYPAFEKLLKEAILTGLVAETESDLKPFNLEELDKIRRNRRPIGGFTAKSAIRLAASYLTPERREAAVKATVSMREENPEYVVRITKECFNVMLRRAEPERPNVEQARIEMANFGLIDDDDFEEFVTGNGLLLDTLVIHKADDEGAGYTGKVLINLPGQFLPEHRHVDMVVLRKGTPIPKGFSDARMVNGFEGVLEYNSEGAPTGRVLYSIDDYTIALADNDESTLPKKLRKSRKLVKWLPAKSEMFEFEYGDGLLFGDISKMTITHTSTPNYKPQPIPKHLRSVAQRYLKRQDMTVGKNDVMYVEPGVCVKLKKNTRHAVYAGKRGLVYKEYSMPSRDESDIFTNPLITRQPDKEAMRVSRAVQFHIKAFGVDPNSAAKAPGRSNIIGEHTDYAGGLVLPIALKGLNTIACVSEREDDKVVIQSPRFGKFEMTLDEIAQIPVEWDRYAEDEPGESAPGRLHIPDEHKWARYPIGVIRRLMEAGVDVKGVNLSYDGNVPIGGGLSSSASINVAIFLALKGYLGFDIHGYDAVLLCQAAEHWLGSYCGTMDQYASLFGIEGSALMLDCEKGTHEEVDLSFLEEAGYRIVLADSRLPKTKKAWATYNTRTKQLACAKAFLVDKYPDTFKDKNTIMDLAPNVTPEFLATIKDDLIAYVDAWEGDDKPVKTTGKDVYKALLHVATEQDRVVKQVKDIVRQANILSAELKDCDDDEANIMKRKQIDGLVKQLGKVLNEGNKSLQKVYRVSSPELDKLTSSARKHGAVGARITGAGFVGATINIVKADRVERFKDGVISDYKEAFPDKKQPRLYVTTPGKGALQINLDDVIIPRLAATDNVPDENIEEYIEKVFDVPTDKLRQIVPHFQSELRLGLQGNDTGSSLQMIPTHAEPARRDEKGVVITLDMGGTNFRMLKVEVTGNKKTESVVGKFNMPKGLKDSNARELFDFIAHCIGKFLKDQGMENETGLPLSFIFSFPVEQKSINSGFLKFWTKEFSAEGVVGKDVVNLLNEALRRSHVDNIEVEAMANDTVAVGDLGRVMFPDGNVRLGVILGTGTNGCFSIDLNKLGQDKYSGQTTPSGDMWMNMEWGGYALSEDIRNSYDRIVDATTKDKGNFLFEKAVSGKYIAELAKAIFRDMVSRGKLLNKRDYKAFRVGDDGLLDGEDISKIARDTMDVIDGRHDLTSYARGRLRARGIDNVSDEDLEFIKKTCKMLLKRSARLAATIIGATLTTFDPNLENEYTVPIDGALYQDGYGYKRYMRAALKGLFGEKASRIKLVTINEMTGKGAAVIGLVAKRKNLKKEAIDIAALQVFANNKKQKTVVYYPSGFSSRQKLHDILGEEFTDGVEFRQYSSNNAISLINGLRHDKFRGHKKVVIFNDATYEDYESAISANKDAFLGVMPLNFSTKGIKRMGERKNSYVKGVLSTAILARSLPKEDYDVYPQYAPLRALLQMYLPEDVHVDDYIDTLVNDCWDLMERYHYILERQLRPIVPMDIDGLRHIVDVLISA